MTIANRNLSIEKALSRKFKLLSKKTSGVLAKLTADFGKLKLTHKVLKKEAKVQRAIAKDVKKLRKINLRYKRLIRKLFSHATPAR